MTYLFLARHFIKRKYFLEKFSPLLYIIPISLYNKTMTVLKIAAVLFVILTLILSIIITKVFRLNKFGFNFADLAFPLFAFEFYFISDKFFFHNWLPLLGVALSILSMWIVIYFLRKKRSFYYPKFFKFFWRAGFILTFFLYLALVISIFL